MTQVYCVRPECQTTAGCRCPETFAPFWTKPSTGWECPRCRKIHAPHIAVCDCPTPGRGYVQPPKSWGRAN